jgi:hypothetical protein
LLKDKYYIYSADQKFIGSYLSQCDFGIIFRDNHIINRVSAPIKIKDYLTSNLRILMTDNIGDSSALIIENELGFVFPSFSKDVMDASLKYITSIDFKNEYTTNPQILKDFSLSFIAKKYKLVYNEL